MPIRVQEVRERKHTIALVGYVSLSMDSEEIRENTMNHITHFINLHCRDLAGAKYSIGDIVRYEHDNFQIKGEGTILAVNNADGDFEYAIDEVPNVLFWEHELSEIQ